MAKPLKICGIGRKQTEEMDSLNIATGVSVVRMMELAGLQVARHAEHFRPRPKRIAVLAGGGHNGGDALCAARHLASKGYNIEVFLAADELKDETKEQMEILRRAGACLRAPGICRSLAGFDLIIDGLFGYNINRNPEGEYARLIGLANESDKPILSIDLPSGLDADGTEYRPVIKAIETLCLGYPKRSCLRNRNAGKVYVGYIGILPAVFRKLRLRPIDFRRNEIVRVK